MGSKDTKTKIFGRSFLIRYTLLFVLTSFVVFLWYFLTGRTFIWHADGLTQHYNALIFYGDYLREVLRTVFVEHSLNIPSFSFSIGEGGDILTTLHYYCIGDPLCALSVFFNEGNMYILYCAIVLVRLYSSGLTFSFLCKETGVPGDKGILTGALSYVFCYFAVYNSARHIFFLIPMVLLPLVLAGTERVLRRKSPYVLMASVFLSAISNFYFFYMIVIMTVVYTAVRLVILNGKDLRSYLVPVRDMFFYSLTGLLSAGVVFFPVAFSFLSDVRNSGVNRLRLLYPLDYYLDLPRMLLTPDNLYWMCICFVPAVTFALLYLFSRKGNSKTLKVLAVISLVFVFFPLFGQIFNGRSYMCNRWCFALALLSSYILSACFGKMTEEKLFFKREALIFSGVLALLLIVTGNIASPGVIAALLITLIFCLVMAFLPEKKRDPRILGNIILGTTVVSLAVSSFYLNSAGGQNYAAESRRPSEIEEYYNDDGLAAQSLLGGESYRYSGAELQWNSALRRGVSSPDYYWTLSNPYCVEFNDSLDLRIYDMFKYDNFDDRTIMTDLSSVLYYIVPEDYGMVPYGYVKEESSVFPGHDIYRNETPLGLCFTSDSVIRRSYWDGLSPVEKEEALLYGVVIPDGSDSSLREITPDLSSFEPEVGFDFDPSPIELDPEGSVKALSTGAFFYLRFDGLPDCETMVTFKGIELRDETESSIVLRSSAGDTKVLDLYEDGYEYYTGRHDFTVNMGYGEEPLSWIAVAFVKDGTYTFDDIGVTCLPMEDTAELLNGLRRESPEVLISTDTISCRADLKETELLVFTVPYSSGWSAEVDGERAEIIPADVKYMAVEVPEGEHDIRLSYRTPRALLGDIASLTGLALTTLTFFMRRKRGKEM